MKDNTLIIGNSDGIGLAVTEKLLKQGREVIGMSRRESPISDSLYEHIVVDVQDSQFEVKLKAVLDGGNRNDVCIFCVGIGELLDFSNMKAEIAVVEVNLLAMIKTVACVIPAMVNRGKGHFIGLSSLGDELLSPEAPSYHASKAGFSHYLESLALALKPKGVQVTNVRFGFVDTKMAKGDLKPFMMSVDRAASHIIRCIEKRPVRYSAPWAIIPLIKFRNLMLRLSSCFSK